MNVRVFVSFLLLLPAMASAEDVCASNVGRTANTAAAPNAGGANGVNTQDGGRVAAAAGASVNGVNAPSGGSGPAAAAGAGGTGAGGTGAGGPASAAGASNAGNSSPARFLRP